MLLTMIVSTEVDDETEAAAKFNQLKSQVDLDQPTTFEASVSASVPIS